MKKTLTLLALTTAALMPMMPLGAFGEIVWVKGITWDGTNWNSAQGWTDATKNWKTDGGLCWAATCSNLVNWWQNRQPEGNLPDDAPTGIDSIWDTYRDGFENRGGFIEQGLKWWFTGDQGDQKIGNYLYPRTETSLDGKGGYYEDKLKGGIVPAADLFNLNPMSYGSVANFSTALVGYMKDGYGVGLSWISRGAGGGNVGHAVTVWGVELNAQNEICKLFITDSDDKDTHLTAVAVEPTWYYEYRTLGKSADNLKSKVEYFTLIHSTFSNEETPPNYLEGNNVILKYEVAGGFTVDEDVKDVGQIQYDIYAASYRFRHLTVDHDLTAGSILVQAAEMNLLDVEEGKKLIVKDNITGKDYEQGRKNTLTKTGLGSLELRGSSESIVLEVMAGDVQNFGKLGDVTLANGGSLVNEGTAANLTVKDGSVIEIVRTEANSSNTSNVQAFTLCTVEEGGVLTGTGTFGEVVVQKGGTLKVGNGPELQVFHDSLKVYAGNLVFSIDDAAKFSHYATEGDNGWDSGRYSSINMSNRYLTLENPEFTFALGENILKSAAGTDDLLSMVGQSFTLNLDLRLFTKIANIDDFKSMVANFGDSNTHFILSEDDAKLLDKGLVAEFSTENLEYYINAAEMYMRTGLNVTLAKAPAVPEPTTSTLSLLALASLCARRRRK
ncbi:MAG: hypothetical protein Q4F30_02360 [Akkermansia sp.]|nr:hypothetical protein [Akkermansia sp.]